MSSPFLPVIEDFLKLADPYDKYKHDWSCHRFYMDLKDQFDLIEAEIPIHFTSLPISDRQIFIDAYLKHIKLVTNNFIAGNSERANKCLFENKLSIETLFDNLIFRNDLNYNSFPGFMEYNHDQLNINGADTNISDLHSSFIFLISDFFIDKLVSLLESLLATSTNNKKTKVTPTEIEVKTVLYSAFKLIEFHIKSLEITDVLNSLKSHNLIAISTNKKDFHKIFNNTKPEQPIQWTGNISELSCFVKLLSNNFKLIEDLKKDKWKVTGQLFIDKDSNPFDWKKFRRQQQPASAKQLEKIVKQLV